MYKEMEALCLEFCAWEGFWFCSLAVLDNLIFFLFVSGLTKYVSGPVLGLIDFKNKLQGQTRELNRCHSLCDCLWGFEIG